MLQTLNTYDDELKAASGINFSGYSVRTPFTVLRSLMVELIVTLVESDINAANALTDTVWKTMLTWYRHSFDHRLILLLTILSG